MPEKGDNAILKLTRAINQLESHLVPKLKEFTHDKLGPSTINFGVIRGGSRPNIVPDLAEAEIDIRFSPSLQNAGGALKLLADRTPLVRRLHYRRWCFALGDIHEPASAVRGRLGVIAAE